MFRKTMIAVALATLMYGAAARAETPGISESEVKIGATFPFSGPASPLGNTGKGLIAYVI